MTSRVIAMASPPSLKASSRVLVTVLSVIPCGWSTSVPNPGLSSPRLVELLGLFDHSVDYPHDPTEPVWTRPDRRPIQRDRPRSVWTRPDRRRAPGYGSGGWGVESLAAR